MNILLSIKRPYSQLILDGKKTIELRKNAPKMKLGDHVTLWLYESGKDGQREIIAKCNMLTYVALRHMPFGDALEMVKKEACVTEEQLREYMPCATWHVHSAVRFKVPVPLSDIGLTRPPQSWQYLDDKQACRLYSRLVHEKFTPSPMPAALQARLAEAMEGAREEVQS